MRELLVPRYTVSAAAVLGPADLADYLPAFAMTGVARAALLMFTAYRLAHREL